MDYIDFWEEVSNNICLKCGKLCEWNGDCIDCEEVEPKSNRINKK